MQVRLIVTDDLFPLRGDFADGAGRRPLILQAAGALLPALSGPKQGKWV